MALMSHMIKDRHGTYYARRVIPPALRPFMPEPWQGKSEWRRTLGTKDPKAAKRAHIAMLARMDADFSVAETRQSAANRDSLTDEEIATLSEWFRLEELHQDDLFREVEHREDEETFAEVRAQVLEAGGTVRPGEVHLGWVSVIDRWRPEGRPWKAFKRHYVRRWGTVILASWMAKRPIFSPSSAYGSPRIARPVDASPCLSCGLQRKWCGRSWRG